MAVIPPTVVLPPIVGSVASLNTFVAVVGPSGSGKGASDGVARDLLQTTPRVHTVKPGSGEGIPKEYAWINTPRGKTPIQHPLRNSVLFNVSEIDTLANLGRRSGSTLMPELRAAWSGEELGFAYSDQTKKLRIEPHRFRMCLVTGVQPGQAGALFEETSGGTPQRFLWMPTNDLNRPRSLPDEPPPLDLPEWPGRGVLVTEPDDDGVEREDLGLLKLHLPVERIEWHTLDVPQAVRDAIHQDRSAGLDRSIAGAADVDPLEGHWFLVRLKIAAGLMWLNGRRDGVTDEDWELAGVVKAVSDRTRAEAQEVLAKNARQESIQRGRAAGHRSVAAREVTEEDDIKRAAQRITGYLERKGGTATRSLIRKDGLRPDIKPLIDDALARLVDAGTVTVTEGDHGRVEVSLCR
ncbi:MAG TPA: hypothetical protein H9759_09300 [Candidatus Dietzia intestinipullorum]|nr:hypothetical protein [Candidatus Dietzia intestinipullorum]